MDVAVFVLAAVILLILCSGGYVFFVACRRGKELPWLEKERLKGTAYEKYADHIQNSHKWLMEHKAQDVYIESQDGLKLHGLWVPVADAKGTILLAHGYRSTILVDFGLVLDVYHDMKLNLLIPDQRCHGKSEGKYITFGVKESDDMRRWLEFHQQQLGGGQVVISGLSMGASTMMYLADQPLGEHVKAMIVDCGFTSPVAILSKVYSAVTHLPAIPSIWATDLFARVFAGFSIYEKDSRITLKQSRLPVMMVHGTDDDFVPCYMTRQGYEVCASQKELFLVEGAGHGTSFLKEPEKYKKLVRDFLHRNLENME